MYKSINFVSTDNTETGYALGQPKHRETIPSTERSLSPSACAIIRTLMHCSLLWSSCTNEVLLTEGQQLCIVHCFQ